MELACSVAPLSGNEVGRTISVHRNYNLGSATRDPDSAKANRGLATVHLQIEEAQSALA